MFVFVISNFMKSSTVYAANLCTFVRFESMIWPRIRFGISLHAELLKAVRSIFSLQTERKRSEEYLAINLAVERKLWAIFLLRLIHVWKKQTPGGRLKVNIINLSSSFLKAYSCEDSGFWRHFSACLREWKLLSLLMIHRIIFLLLIVSSVSCNFNRLSVLFVFIVDEHRLQEYSKMPRVSNAL